MYLSKMMAKLFSGKDNVLSCRRRLGSRRAGASRGLGRASTAMSKADAFNFNKPMFIHCFMR